MTCKKAAMRRLYKVLKENMNSTHYKNLMWHLENKTPMLDITFWHNYSDRGGKYSLDYMLMYSCIGTRSNTTDIYNILESRFPRFECLCSLSVEDVLRVVKRVCAEVSMKWVNTYDT